jgi:hypothetical protein
MAAIARSSPWLWRICRMCLQSAQYWIAIFDAHIG